MGFISGLLRSACKHVMLISSFGCFVNFFYRIYYRNYVYNGIGLVPFSFFFYNFRIHQLIFTLQMPKLNVNRGYT